MRNLFFTSAEVKIIIIGMLFVSAMAIGQIPRNPFPMAKFTIHVQDEAGNPIQDAKITFQFIDPEHIEWGGTRGKFIYELSDSNGNATASGYSDGLGSTGALVDKEGYYRGYSSDLVLKDVDEIQKHWKPWDGTYTVTLLKIINPVPMYARNVNLDIPIKDQPLGYDLAASDWVAPFGKGTTNDIIFTLNHSFNDKYNFKTQLALRFPNPGDGLILIPKQKSNGSDLRFPRIAPIDGYQINSLLFNEERSSDNGYVQSYPEAFGYFMRVRTRFDNNGKLIHANYGKILGNYFFIKKDTIMYILGSGTPTNPNFVFTYYLNPDGTPNLEFDPKRNLLKLKDFLENVKYP